MKGRTAGVNPLDNMIIHGEVKLVVPYAFPLVMGNEFVGIIEKTGRGVKGFKDTPIEASVDEVFRLDDVNKALKKVASGRSKGKTILKI